MAKQHGIRVSKKVLQKLKEQKEETIRNPEDDLSSWPVEEEDWPTIN